MKHPWSCKHMEYANKESYLWKTKITKNDSTQKGTVIQFYQHRMPRKVPKSEYKNFLDYFVLFHFDYTSKVFSLGKKFCLEFSAVKPYKKKSYTWGRSQSLLTTFVVSCGRPKHPHELGHPRERRQRFLNPLRVRRMTRRPCPRCRLVSLPMKILKSLYFLVHANLYGSCTN